MRSIPSAKDVVVRSQVAVKATEEVKSAATIDPARLAKAAEGLKNRATARIAEYFDRNAAHPFTESGRTYAIELATVPAYFGVTSLGKELRAAKNDDTRLPALTEPLRQLLESKGFGARFSVDNVGDWADVYALCVTLSKKESA